MKAVMKNGSVFSKADVPPSARKITVCHEISESGTPVSSYELKLSASKRNTGCWMFQHAPVAELLPCGTYFIKYEVSDKKITTEEVAKKLKEIINIDPYLEVYGDRDLLDFLGIFVETDDGKSQLRYGLTIEFVSRFLSINKPPYNLLMIKIRKIEANLVNKSGENNARIP